MCYRFIFSYSFCNYKNGLIKSNISHKYSQIFILHLKMGKFLMVYVEHPHLYSKTTPKMEVCQWNMLSPKFAGGGLSLTKTIHGGPKIWTTFGGYIH